MRRHLSLLLLLLAAISGGHWAYLRGNIWWQIRPLKNANGLRVVGWPSGQVLLTDAKSNVIDFSLPKFLNQQQLQDFQVRLQFPGQPAQPLKFTEEEIGNSEKAGLIVAFAGSFDRLSYGWGWLLALFLALASRTLHPRQPSSASLEEDRIEEGGGFSGYRLGARLGQGATGTVWEARCGERRVAIKVLNPTVLSDPQFLNRFEREFEVARQFNHPRLVGCHCMGKVKDTYFLVMDHYSGGSLAGLLQKEPLSVAKAVYYGLQIAQGLRHAHQLGVIHRDLKPDNVLLDSQGEAAIADFGLARSQDCKTITVTGTVMGTPAYLAPDALNMERTGPPADIYSLGVILYELLEGRLPFAGEDVMKIFTAHLSQQPPPLRSQIPEPLRALVTQMLSKLPADRPDADQVVKRLQATVVEA